MAVPIHLDRSFSDNIIQHKICSAYFNATKKSKTNHPNLPIDDQTYNRRLTFLYFSTVLIEPTLGIFSSSRHHETTCSDQFNEKRQPQTQQAAPTSGTFANGTDKATCRVIGDGDQTIVEPTKL